MGEKQSDEDQVCLFNIVHVFRLQSLDYDVCYNKPFSKMLASRDKKVRMSDKIKYSYWLFLLGLIIYIFIYFLVAKMRSW